MQHILLDLERSSKETKQRLKSETKLRREAERALAELESAPKNRASAFPIKSMDSGIVTETASNTTKGYAERELEAVTAELIATQKKLRKTKDDLDKSQALTKDLERNLHNIGGDESAKILSGDDEALLRELDEIRAEIDAARNDIQSHSPNKILGKQQIFDYEKELEDTREENARLTEEISCLRNIIYDQDTVGSLANEKALNHVDKVKLRREVESLRNKLQRAQDDYERQIVDIEIYWRNKSQQANIEKHDPEEVSDDDIIGLKFANDNSSSRRERALEKKAVEAEELLKKSEEECSKMRSEVLSLTESLYKARQNRSEASKIGINESKRQEGVLLEAWNEVEDKKKEIIALENQLVSTQNEVRLLSEEISNMSGAFEKAQLEYNSVVDELEKVQDLYELSLKATESNSDGAEISLLRTQFQILNEKNEALGRHVKKMENEILSVREEQEEVLVGVEARTAIAEELQATVDRAVDETDQRNQEVEAITNMMEARLRGTEESVDMLEKQISAVSRIASNGATIAGTNEQSPSNGWLMNQYYSEKNEKAKAAISATMSYLSASSKSSVGRDEDDKILDDLLSLAERTATSASEVQNAVPSVQKNPYQSTIDGSPRLLEISKAIEKLTTISNTNKWSPKTETSDGDDTVGSATASLSSNSLQSIRSRSKYAEILQKVADYNKSFSPVAENENDDEARGEVGVEERE
ncbi:unnamed protein product [Pseudo-nitzschia multistriata]|uniref:Uncharacterized protein n=1 Tax=Pseudo-nitzschia multistriata TaxID=183589 RepID=A0A448Z1X8_9STRA|nr:unnamed protein product [Pseudo-nitzschia multistriata]